MNMCIVYKKYRGLSRKRSELENVSWKTDKRWGLWRLFYREEKEGFYGERRKGNIVSGPQP